MKFDKGKLDASGLASSPVEDFGRDLDSCGECVICREHLNRKSTFESTVTKKSFSLPKEHNIHQACTTKGVVYLITCRTCCFQYMGMTTSTLRQRFYGHRSAINYTIQHTNFDNL